MILYFSATGNCKYTAEKIARLTGDVAISITDVKESIELKKGEQFGIVTPVYFCRLPAVFKKLFIRLAIKHSGDNYVFCVVTYGTVTGDACYSVAKYLEEKDMRMNAQFSVKMPDTYTPIFDVSNNEKMRQICQAAELEIDEVAEKVSKRQSGDYCKAKLLPVLAGTYHRVYEKARRTEHFGVSYECIGCGVCEKVCPEGAIRIDHEVERPEWIKDKCSACLACLHRCPSFAISYGKNTKRHGQYTHEMYEDNTI